MPEYTIERTVQYTEAEHRMSALLLTAWDVAEARDDDEMVGLCKRALDALDLPWVELSAR